MEWVEDNSSIVIWDKLFGRETTFKKFKWAYPFKGVRFWMETQGPKRLQLTEHGAIKALINSELNIR